VVGIRRSSTCIAFSSEIDLLMYSTFAVQSGESARQQRLAIALQYVLLWSDRAVIHLANDDSWHNPPPLRVARKDPQKAVREAMSGVSGGCWPLSDHVAAESPEKPPTTRVDEVELER
jgi:hypothetical protein